MMHVLDQTLWFPDPTAADEHGIVAVGGDLSPQRVLLAYKQGMFPWFSEDEPILWWSPDPRMVLYPTEFKISKSLKKTLRTTSFTVTFNTAFAAVMDACSKMERPGQDGTWISQEMKQTYLELHRQKFAISVEVWDGDILVGGLYGIDLPGNKLFSGESMFSIKTDASKIAFAHLVAWSITQNYTLIDCQVYTSHLESLGAREIDREVFLSNLS
jgi:leucyl/phenylalanyl-tRNA--protein transferase